MRRPLLVLLLVLALGLLAAVELRVAVAIDGKRLTLALSAIEHLLEGETHWRVYGGRVLTPVLLRGAMALTGAAALPAFLGLMAALLAIGKFAAWWGLRPLARSDAEAWVALLALTLGGLLLRNGQPLYLWDAVDMVLAALAVGLCARGGGSIAAWALLLLLAACNREGAVLLGVAPVVHALTGGRRDGRTAMLAGALTAGAFGLAFALREAVFVRATLEVGEGAARAGAGIVHLRVAENFATLGTELLGLLEPMRLLALRPLVVLPALVPLLALALRPRAVWQRLPGITTTAWLLVGATLVAGEVLEGRVWAILLPLDAALMLAMLGGPSAPSSAKTAAKKTA